MSKTERYISPAALRQQEGLRNGLRGQRTHQKHVNVPSIWIRQVRRKADNHHTQRLLQENMVTSMNDLHILTLN